MLTKKERKQLERLREKEKNEKIKVKNLIKDIKKYYPIIENDLKVIIQQKEKNEIKNDSNEKKTLRKNDESENKIEQKFARVQNY